MNIKNVIVASAILFIFWVLLNNSFEWHNLAIGAGLSVFISLVFCQRCKVFESIKLTPAALFYTFVYLFVFMVELVKSNLDVALRVIKPSLPIKPGIVEVHTKLKSPMGRMILANSITLTPGTLTVNIEDDKLFIHWIEVKTVNPEEATEAIVRKFEKLLEKIYD